MAKKVIISENVPPALGPYSHAVVSNGFLFVSGQIPICKNGGISDNVEDQTIQVFENLQALLKDCDLSLKNVVKTTLFIKNMDDFNKINKIYGTFFTDNFPARSCIEVARLPKDVLIEAEIIAALD